MIILSICCSWMWWIYLANNAHMVIAQDALSYEDLGRQIASLGFFPNYFVDGPLREPVYPLLVAFAMKIEFWYHWPYQKVMALLGITILGLNQLCTLRLLQLLKIRPIIITAALLYLGFSPAMNNAALSLYSEISVIVFILPLMLMLYYLITSIKNASHLQSFIVAFIIGILIFLLTMVKASFEIIGPIFIFISYFLLWRKFPREVRLISLCLAISLFTFILSVHRYKSFNQFYNGQYVVTNRASWALYGNTVRRMEPLTTPRLIGALAYVPGEGVCHHLAKPADCDFWSYRLSDAYGMTRLSQLQHTTKNDTAINQQLFNDTAQAVLKNPLQYILLTKLEAIKMFFWESTQIGFVDYPAWLTNIYANMFFKNILRIIVSIATAFAVIFIWLQMLRKKSDLLIQMLGFFIALFIGIYALFFILTRYALPIAPLYIIAIAYTANILYNKRHEKN